jgi:protein-S-isoprenylcysteine O-methyltransferase Ste14
MDLFVIALSSPLVAATVTLVVFILCKVARLNRPSGKDLVVVSLVAATVCAGLSLAYTIFEMVKYEMTTGYSAGNGPLAWIFITGPLSVAAGFLIALVLWLCRWPSGVWRSQVRSNASVQRARDG